MMRRTAKLLIAGTVLLGVAGLGGCATKNYVAEQLSPLSARIAAQGAKLDSVDKTANDALQRADAAGKLAEGKFVYSMVFSDDSIKFPSGKATLSPEAQSRLDAFINKLKTDNRNVYIEIQGHTDAREASDKLGADRAEAVRRYLAKQGVPLNRVGVISFGADSPMAPNDTREGREANRRVVLIVLA